MIGKLDNTQLKVMDMIKEMAAFFEVDESWAIAVALTESSLGKNQKSPTGCRGVFQMSKIAMLDLLLEMENNNDDKVDIACGVAFLFLLLKRWGSKKVATEHFCDPKDKSFYLTKVNNYIRDLGEEGFLTTETLFSELKNVIHSTYNSNFYFEQNSTTTKVWLQELCKLLDKKFKKLRIKI